MRISDWSSDVCSSDLFPKDELLGAFVRDKLLYYPTVTREPFRHRGRITELLLSNRLTDDLGLQLLDPEHDRAILCGSPAMLKDLPVILEDLGFVEGNNSTPGPTSVVSGTKGYERVNPG